MQVLYIFVVGNVRVQRCESWKFSIIPQIAALSQEMLKLQHEGVEQVELCKYISKALVRVKTDCMNYCHHCFDPLPSKIQISFNKW